jgi:shikimate dehydrogenase
MNAAGTAPIRLALIGDPIDHSLSPALHREFLAAAGVAGTYDAIRVPSGQCADTVDKLRAQGYRGVNVTTPLKEEAFARCERHDRLAAASRSVNTIVFEYGAAFGYNTDGAGALGALRVAVRRDLAALAVLVLGAGPTARAAVYALLDAGARVTLWNRTRVRAEAVGDALGVALWTLGWRIDAVLSTLAPGAEIGDEAVRAAVIAAPLVVDANYGARATLGAALGRPVVEGLEMLRASARASFELFVPARAR